MLCGPEVWGVSDTAIDRCWLVCVIKQTLRSFWYFSPSTMMVLIYLTPALTPLTTVGPYPLERTGRPTWWNRSCWAAYARGRELSYDECYSTLCIDWYRTTAHMHHIVILVDDIVPLSHERVRLPWSTPLASKRDLVRWKTSPRVRASTTTTTTNNTRFWKWYHTI